VIPNQLAISLVDSLLWAPCQPINGVALRIFFGNPNLIVLGTFGNGCGSVSKNFKFFLLKFNIIYMF
jgi:hypothetical protein